MQTIWDSVAGFLPHDRVAALLRVALLVGLGWPLARWLNRTIGTLLRARASGQTAMLAQRLAYYSLLAVIVIAALRQLGFELNVLLGAAGIVTVAIGFASQTSMSNLISGLFLVGERPFVVGDIITVGETTGEVLTIDLLAVKIRTFDNLYVRVPNETLIKSQITNLTRFPIRRIDLQLTVAYKEDLAKVKRVVEQVADAHPLCLEEPAPLVMIKGWGSSSVDIQFSVWGSRTNFLTLRTEMYAKIKSAFETEAIEIPLPHTSLYTGAATEPFPIRIVTEPSPPPDETTESQPK